MPVRLFYFIEFILIILLLLISVYLQMFQGMEPCPLCTLQRITFGVLGVLFLIGLLISHSFFGRIVINSLATLFSLVGLTLAARQIWLQLYPGASSNECGVSLQYILQVLPLNEAFQKVFAGTSECTQRGWEFLHFNMAEWSLIWFMVFFMMSLFLFLKEFKWHNSPH